MSIMATLSPRTGPASLKCPHTAQEPAAGPGDAACITLPSPVPAACPAGNPTPVDEPADPPAQDAELVDEPPSDAELIDAVRKGALAAYGDLYERHVSAAYNLARQLSRSQAEADDLVSEAFAKVLETLRNGRGPDSAFRAYLLTALRNTAYDKTRRDRKVELTEDVTAVSGVRIEEITESIGDPPVARLERWLAAMAFCHLPERCQAVLWHTVIEQLTPAETAPILGLRTPNGVSALAYRARQGLCMAYLQAQVRESPNAPIACRATLDRLGAWTRAELSKRETQQVETHLDECKRCLARMHELAADNPRLFRQWEHPNPRLVPQCA